MSKLFLKTFNKLFRSMKSSCPKRRRNTSTAPDFCHGSVVQQRISISEGGSVRNQLSSTVSCPYKEWYERSFYYWPTAVGRYSLQVAEVRKAQFNLGFLALMLYSAHTLNCRIGKG
jgi:hypothetical protein